MNSPAHTAGARRPRDGVARRWARTTVSVTAVSVTANAAETVIFYPPEEATAAGPTVPAGSGPGTASSNTSVVHDVADSTALVPSSDPLLVDPTACPA